MSSTSKSPSSSAKNPSRSKKAFYAYLLRCADGTFYAGSTDNLEKRLHAHNHLKSGAHYTKIRRPVALCYSKRCENYSAARAREAELKRMSREEKLALATRRRG